MSINLWEAITAAEINHKKLMEGKDPRAYGPEVSTDQVTALSRSARWSGQELSIEPTEEGWLIKVFSCYDSVDGIEILIPKDHKLPAKIVLDRNGRIIHVHD